jgi:hypothetical protein
VDGNGDYKRVTFNTAPEAADEIYVINPGRTTSVFQVSDNSIITSMLQDEAVTSAKIADNTIVNANINSSAAIAYSKLNLATSIANADISSTAGITLNKISGNTSFKNIVINGDMKIAQRNTSVASITGSDYYTLDRWATTLVTLGTWTQSQSTDVPSGYGFATSLKMDCTTADATPAASDLLIIRTRFEGQNLQYLKKGTADALPLTASFWVKSTKTGTFIVELVDVDNTRQISKSYTISASNTWEFKTVTFPADTTGVLDNNNETSLALDFFLAAGSDFTSGTLNTTWAATINANRAVGQVNCADSTANDWLITGVQLETGEQASGFEFLPIDVSLVRCLRYFYQVQGNALNNTTLGIGFSNSSTNNQCYFKFPTTMRTTPTITGSSGIQVSDNNSYSINATAVAVNNGDKNNMNIEITVASGLTVFRGGGVYLTNSTASYLALSSEL